MAKTSTPQQPTTEMELWAVIDQAVTSIPEVVDATDAEAMRLCMTLRTAANLVYSDLRQNLLANSDLNSPALTVLMIAQLHEEVEFRHLTTFAGMKKATASELVNSLVVEGFLQRRVSPTDRRVVLISCTDLGREVFGAAFTTFNTREQFWAAGLTGREQKTLVGLLKKMVDSRIGDESYAGD